ncbi:MAG: DUF6252 family protein [Bacteroidota bacterium]
MISISLLIVQCKKDEDQDDMEEFNPHISCIANSVDFNTNQLEIFPGQNALQIIGTSGSETLTLQIENPQIEGATVLLDGTTISSAVFEDLNNGIQYLSDDGSLTISRYDTTTGEMEGSFQFHGIEFFGSAEINVINGSFACIVPQ